MIVVTFDAAGNAYEHKLPEWTQAEEIGYKPVTTFWQKFSLAELCADPGVIAHTARAIIAGGDVKQITELALVLNHKGFWWYAAANTDGAPEKNSIISRAYSHMYFRLWEQVDNWAKDNFTGDDAEYYFKVTD